MYQKKPHDENYYLFRKKDPECEAICKTTTRLNSYRCRRTGNRTTSNGLHLCYRHYHMFLQGKLKEAVGYGKCL